MLFIQSYNEVFMLMLCILSLDRRLPALNCEVNTVLPLSSAAKNINLKTRLYHKTL